MMFHTGAMLRMGHRFRVGLTGEGDHHSKKNVGIERGSGNIDPSPQVGEKKSARLKKRAAKASPRR